MSLLCSAGRRRRPREADRCFDKVPVATPLVQGVLRNDVHGTAASAEVLQFYKAAVQFSRCHLPPHFLCSACSTTMCRVLPPQQWAASTVPWQWPASPLLVSDLLGASLDE